MTIILCIVIAILFVVLIGMFIINFSQLDTISAQQDEILALKRQMGRAA